MHLHSKNTYINEYVQVHCMCIYIYIHEIMIQLNSAEKHKYIAQGKIDNDKYLFMNRLNGAQK